MSTNRGDDGSLTLPENNEVTQKPWIHLRHHRNRHLNLELRYE